MPTRPAGGSTIPPERAARDLGVEGLLRAFLMYGVVPAWLAAGFADYLCHRRSRIEATSGVRESLMHALQLVEVGLPMLAVLFLDVNATLLLLLVGAVVLHQATAAWDVRYANATRRVSPLEQHVHGVLEMAPIVAAATVAILNPDAVHTLLAQGPGVAPQWRDPPLPVGYVVTLLAAVVVLGIVPYGEELWRTARWRGRMKRPAV